MARVALTAGLIISLTACGFYLKGQRPGAVALESVSISYEQPYRVGDPPLVMALENRLRARGALVQRDAETRIHINGITNEQRVLSVSPVDGRVSEIELFSTANFNVTRNGDAVLRQQSLTVRRAYSFDNTERLASEEEQKDLINAMHSELADLVLLRAEFAVANPDAVAETPPASDE